MPSGWTQRITGPCRCIEYSEQLEVWTKAAAAGDLGATTSMTLTGADAKFVGGSWTALGHSDAVSTFATSTASASTYTTPLLAVTTGALPIAIVTDRAAGAIPPNDAYASVVRHRQAAGQASGTQVSGSGQNAHDLSLCIVP